MKHTTAAFDCVAFKNELHNNLYKKSGAHSFNEYIQYINSVYSDTHYPGQKTPLQREADQAIAGEDAVSGEPAVRDFQRVADGAA